MNWYWYLLGGLTAAYLIGQGGKAFIAWYDRTHPDNFPPMTGE